MRTKTQREIYCGGCDSFQPFTTDNGSLLCGRCNSVLGRSNAEGLMYCDNCGDYHAFFEENPLRRPLPGDEPNRGYVLGDMVCNECCSILATVREPEP